MKYISPTWYTKEHEITVGVRDACGDFKTPRRLKAIEVGGHKTYRDASCSSFRPAQAARDRVCIDWRSERDVNGRDRAARLDRYNHRVMNASRTRVKVTALHEWTGRCRFA